MVIDLINENWREFVGGSWVGQEHITNNPQPQTKFVSEGAAKEDKQTTSILKNFIDLFFLLLIGVIKRYYNSN